MSRSSGDILSIKPIRVAILGGGPAALTTAFELTNPDQNSSYEVTVYQMGWRLGGKCASGRNRNSHNRIEEHGLHVFFGYYDNSFEVLKKVYEGQASLGAQKYPTIYDALVPSNNITLCEKDGEKWDTWSIRAPDMPGLPGKDKAPDLWSLFLHGLSSVSHLIGLFSSRTNDPQPGQSEPHWWSRLTDISFKDIEHLFEHEGGRAFSIARAFAEGMDPVDRNHGNEHQSRLVSLLEDAKQEIENIWKEEGFDSWWSNLEKDLRRLYIMLDLAFTVGLGALRSGLFFDHTKAVAKLNEVDFRAWLTLQGAKQITVESAFVRAFYDLTFAYPDGDHNSKGDLAAGSTLAGLFNMILYRGAFLWKMRAGTGDIAAAPLYKVLQSRGVKFEFFNKVTELVPSLFQDQIETVKISRQVQLTGADYNPLFTCDGLDCWPSEPDYDQIVEGAELKHRKINLESRWTTWQNTGGDIELQYGRDFDVIVLGIPVDALPDICPQILKQKADWRAMVKNVKTVQTQSMQLLFNDDRTKLGSLPAGTVIGANDTSPFNASADISEVLSAETWDANGPKHLSISSGALPGPSTAPAPCDHDFPAAAKTMVKKTALSFIKNGAPVLWPKITETGKFDWNALWSPSDATGAKRLDSQYLRANIDPDQRYTLSVAGSAAYRLRTDASGYYNLYLTGDWTDNPGNLGGFESTIMSGRLASRAISGLPKQIARVDAESPYYNMRKPYENPQKAPLFVEYNGIQTFPGPFTFHNVEMWSFFLPGNYAKMQTMVDRIFNIPSGGAVSYVPLSSMMMMTFMDITDASSRYHTQASGAYEREVAFWIFLGREETPGSGKIVDLAGFTPYLVINNPLGYTEGRDVWGYAKQPGHVTLPSSNPPVTEFIVDAFGVKSDPFTEPWDYQRLLTVKPVAGSQSGNERSWSGLPAMVGEIERAMRDLNIGLDPTWQLTENLLEDFIHKRMQQVFLKQFRDIVVPERACYQAITRAATVVEKIEGITLTQSYEMVVEDLFNTALVETLGIGANVKLPFGMHFTMDFSLQNGSILWKAGE